jgi:hypothetical protein
MHFEIYLALAFTDRLRNIKLNIAYRSTFVSVVAWVFIVVSGLGTLVTTLQNFIIHFLGQQMALIFQAGLPQKASWFTIFVLTHLKLYFAVVLAIVLFTFVSSIGLLNRKNWARLTFVGLMILGIMWNLPTLFSSLAALRPNVLFELGLILIFGWIGRRLLSAPVVAEFSGNR